jgi:hypothetical protein
MTVPWSERIDQRTTANAGYGRKGSRESYGKPLDKSPAAANERRRLYAEARDAGESPWAACLAAGWDPGSQHSRERWYQAMKAGLIVQGEDGKWTSPK